MLRVLIYTSFSAVTNYRLVVFVSLRTALFYGINKQLVFHLRWLECGEAVDIKQDKVQMR